MKQRKFSPTSFPSGGRLVGTDLQDLERASPIRRQLGTFNARSRSSPLLQLLCLAAAAYPTVIHPNSNAFDKRASHGKPHSKRGSRVACDTGRRSDDMMLAYSSIRKPLSISGQFRVLGLITLKTLVATYDPRIDDARRQAGQTTQVNFVRGQSGDVLRGFDMGKLLVPIVLSFVHYHRQHLGHRAVHAFYATGTHSVIRHRSPTSGSPSYHRQY